MRVPYLAVVAAFVIAACGGRANDSGSGSDSAGGASPDDSGRAGDGNRAVDAAAGGAAGETAQPDDTIAVDMPPERRDTPIQCEPGRSVRCSTATCGFAGIRTCRDSGTAVSPCECAACASTSLRAEPIPGRACAYGVPPAPEPTDDQYLNVRIEPEVELLRVSDAASCEGDPGWFLDDGGATIVLCPASCRDAGDSEVAVAFGCRTIWRCFGC